MGPCKLALGSWSRLVAHGLAWACWLALTPRRAHWTGGDHLFPIMLLLMLDAKITLLPILQLSCAALSVRARSCVHTFFSSATPPRSSWPHACDVCEGGVTCSQSARVKAKEAPVVSPGIWGHVHACATDHERGAEVWTTFRRLSACTRSASSGVSAWRRAHSARPCNATQRNATHPTDTQSFSRSKQPEQPNAARLSSAQALLRTEQRRARKA